MMVVLYTKTLIEVFNLDEEQPTKSFLRADLKKSKKVRIAHLRKKINETAEEQVQYPIKEFFDNLIMQTHIENELNEFYQEVYKHRITNPVYTEIPEALGP